MKTAKTISTQQEITNASPKIRTTVQGIVKTQLGTPCLSHHTRCETRQSEARIERSPSFETLSNSFRASRSQPSAHWLAGTPIPTTASTAANVIQKLESSSDVGSINNKMKAVPAVAFRVA